MFKQKLPSEFSPPPPFFHRYVGELITDADADKRENDSFLFTLDNKVIELVYVDF